MNRLTGILAGLVILAGACSKKRPIPAPPPEKKIEQALPFSARLEAAVNGKSEPSTWAEKEWADHETEWRGSAKWTETLEREYERLAAARAHLLELHELLDSEYGSPTEAPIPPYLRDTLIDPDTPAEQKRRRLLRFADESFLRDEGMLEWTLFEARRGKDAALRRTAIGVLGHSAPPSRRLLEILFEIAHDPDLAEPALTSIPPLVERADAGLREFAETTLLGWAKWPGAVRAYAELGRFASEEDRKRLAGKLKKLVALRSEPAVSHTALVELARLSPQGAVPEVSDFLASEKPSEIEAGLRAWTAGGNKDGESAELAERRAEFLWQQSRNFFALAALLHASTDLGRASAWSRLLDLAAKSESKADRGVALLSAAFAHRRALFLERETAASGNLPTAEKRAEAILERIPPWLKDEAGLEDQALGLTATALAGLPHLAKAALGNDSLKAGKAALYHALLYTEDPQGQIRKALGSISVDRFPQPAVTAFYANEIPLSSLLEALDAEEVFREDPFLAMMTTWIALLHGKLLAPPSWR